MQIIFSYFSFLFFLLIFALFFQLSMIRLIIDNPHPTKIIVDLNPNQQQTILAFLERIVHIAQLKQVSAQQLNIYDEDFLLPHHLPSYCIDESKIYRIEVSSEKGKKDSKKEKKMDIKRKKNERRLSKVESSSESSSSSESLSGSKSSVLQSYFEKKINKKTPINSKTKSGSYKIQNRQRKKNINEEKERRNLSKPDSSQSQISSQLSESIQNNNLKPTAPVTKTNNLGTQQKKTQKIQKIQKIQRIEKLVPPVWNKQKNQKLVQTGRKIVQSFNKEEDQSSLSQSDEQTPEKYAQTVQNILEKIKKPQKDFSNQPKQPNKNQKTNKNQEVKQVSNLSTQPNTNTNIKKPISTPSNIPISVRNKIKSKTTEKKNNKEQIGDKQQSKKIEGQKGQKEGENLNRMSYKQYKQSKWISITRQILNKWSQMHKKQSIIQVKNEIRFKIVELDEQKFIPVNSGWIQGFITDILHNQNQSIVKFDSVVKSAREDKEGSEFIKLYEIAFHNMQEIQIDKNSLTQSQKQVLLTTSEPINTLVLQQTEQVKKQGEQTTKLKQQTKKEEKSEQKKPQSVEQFICGQIHYYFSQKNYPTDLFMQMHANNDPNRFINLKVMLNFPKIKKFLSFNEEQKLWGYLTSDDKYASRNYELDMVRKMIRKK